MQLFFEKTVTIIKSPCYEFVELSIADFAEKQFKNHISWSIKIEYKIWWITFWTLIAFNHQKKDLKMILSHLNTVVINENLLYTGSEKKTVKCAEEK